MDLFNLFRNKAGVKQKMKTLKTEQNSTEHLNPLSSDMKMHILLTILHTFLMKLGRRISLTIKTIHLMLGDHFQIPIT